MLRVLIIDDDIVIREMLVEMLHSEGISVDSAENGKVGLTKLQQQSFNLVITDIIMPEMEGIETIREIRKTMPSIPIISISGGGKTSPEIYLEMAQKLGARYAFVKPIRKQELLVAVRNCGEMIQ